jgi:hypothetical protein
MEIIIFLSKPTEKTDKTDKGFSSCQTKNKHFWHPYSQITRARMIQPALIFSKLILSVYFALSILQGSANSRFFELPHG